MPLIIALLLILVPTQAAHTEAPKVFELGMSKQDVIARFGKPAQYWAVSTRRHISASEHDIVCATEACWPIYDRKTVANEYEITLPQTVDTSASRLHPTLRVREIHFTLDHNMTPEQAVADIAEASALCARGCEYSTRYDTMFVATPNGKRFLLFDTDDQRQHIDKSTPISKLSIADLNIK